MSEILKVLKESIAITKETNAKLDLLGQLSAIQGKPGTLELKEGVKFDTIYSNGATITLAYYPNLGSRTPSHCHDDITEYLICTKGSVSVTFGGGYRVLKTGECVSIPKGCSHSTTSLDKNSILVAVCVPAEPAYAESMKCK